MRPSCPLCCTKHVAQALVLLQEAAQGHPEHRYLAIGHLAEAADEILTQDAGLAADIRTARKAIEGGASPDLLPLLGRAGALVKAADRQPTPATVAPVSPAKKPCTNCGNKTPEALATPRVLGPANDGTRPKVVLMTGFSGWSDTYSLCTVVRSQVRQLLRGGFAVHLWAREGCAPPVGLSASGTPGALHWSPVIPRGSRDDIAAAIRTHLDPLGACKVLGHDVLFQSGYEDIAEALHLVATGEGVDADREWLFQAHSGFGERPDPPTARHRLPANLRCRVVTPGAHLVADAARYYGCDPARVVHLPNLLDPREALGWSETLDRLMDISGWLLADTAVVLPVADAGRLKAKGAEAWIDWLADTKSGPRLVRGRAAWLDWLAETKSNGGAHTKVCGILACAAADSPERLAAFGPLRERAKRAGLDEHEVVFTPVALPETRREGLRKADIRELLRMSGLLVWPSREEADPLVVQESLLAGCDSPVVPEDAAWVKTLACGASSLQAEHDTRLLHAPVRLRRHIRRSRQNQALLDLLR